MSAAAQADLSVITVSYNSATTIGATLASIASQRGITIEHIVVDGASSDTTLEILNTAPGRPTVLSEPDDGLYDAMNKGLRLASGRTIGFLNADDTYASETSAADLVGALHGADADAVYADLVYVRQDDDSKLLRHWHSGAYRPDRLRYGWMPPHPTFYVTRALAARVGAFDTTLRIAADYDYMLRCLLQPGMRTAYLPQVVVRMKAGGASNRSVKALLRKSGEDLKVMRRHGIGGLGTLASKNLRKLPQFFASRTGR